jgi:hypothetical protein
MANEPRQIKDVVAEIKAHNQFERMRHDDGQFNRLYTVTVTLLKPWVIPEISCLAVAVAGIAEKRLQQRMAYVGLDWKDKHTYAIMRMIWRALHGAGGTFRQRLEIQMRTNTTIGHHRLRKFLSIVGFIRSM